jgi:hypothetical protein
LHTGLPDGTYIFKPKIPIWRVLEWKKFVYFIAHLVYFTANWYILWAFGVFYGQFEYFSRFGMLYQEKAGNPACRATNKRTLI